MKSNIKMLYINKDKKLMDKLIKINKDTFYAKNYEVALDIFFSKDINFIIAEVNNFDDFKVLELFRVSNKDLPIIILNNDKIENNNLLLSILNLEVKGIFLDTDDNLALKKIIEKLKYYQVYFKNKQFLGLLNNVMDSHKDMLFSIENEDIVYANKKFLDFFNALTISDFHKKHISLQNEIITHPLSKVSVVSGITTGDFIELLYSLKEENRTIALRNIRGEIQIFMVKITFIKEEYRLFQLIDITDMAKKTCSLEEKADLDQLTKTYNRHKFLEFVKEIELSGRSYCLCILDIDFFKSVNDTYGHDAGDLVLQEVSTLLKNNIRGDDILARWGGEEFILLLQGIKIDVGLRIAEKLRTIIESYEIKEIGRNITVSIGISSNTPDGEIDIIKDIDSVRIQADRALYQAKREGRNRVISL